MAGLFGVWAWNGPKKNPWNTKTREINDALMAIGFDPKQRHKPNVGLLFVLAQWGQRQTKLPRKSLRGYMDDGYLFELLRLHRQVPLEAYGFCDLSAGQLNAVEKRLHHLWPKVGLMLEAINASKTTLQKHNRARRKPVHTKQRPMKSMLAATLAQLDS